MDSCRENFIMVKKGFWRANNLTDLINPCIRSESCLGGENNFNCSQGYVGPLCG